MNENKTNTLDCRFLARIVIEAETPLSVKSGEKSVMTDAVVITDVNGLPYIPGSSIAGVMRHAWKDMKDRDNEENMFGFQKGEKGLGSRVIFTEARILNSNGEVMDGMLSPTDISDDDLLKYYVSLPIRQHVRINHHGVAAEYGKFDEQVVYAGTRFCFEIEMFGNEDEESKFKELLSILNRDSFRLGSGTRSGFGEIKIISIQQAVLSLNDGSYLEKSSNLEESKEWEGWNVSSKGKEGENVPEGWNTYKMTLVPENFFLFGSGFGDEDADMTPVTEMKVSWNNNNHAEIKEHVYLLPASSIKGAIAHRVAYHFNRLTEVFADDFTNDGKNTAGYTIDDYVGANNIAVRLLFGYEGNTKARKIRGNVIFSDLYAEDEQGNPKGTGKILNHVAIDRFTGGTIDGALFSEKTVYGKDITFVLKILVNEASIKTLINEKNIQEKMTTLHQEANQETIVNKTIQALEAALNDVCNGLLPLGGGVNRGNGMFKGKWEVVTKEQKEV